MADDVTQAILLKVAADTDGAVSELKKLNNESEKATKGITVGMADVQAAIGLMTSAYGKAKEAIQNYAKDAQLAHQAQGVSIERLKEATNGLITENELLDIAAKSNASSFKLTQGELDNVGKAMIALRNRGFDLHQVQQNLTSFLVTGNARALREYGVRVEGAAGSTEAFTKGLEQLFSIGNGAGATTDRMGDSFLRASVKFDDAMDNFSNSLARLAVAMTPVVELIAEAVDTATSAINVLTPGGWRERNALGSQLGNVIRGGSADITLSGIGEANANLSVNLAKEVTVAGDRALRAGLARDAEIALQGIEVGRRGIDRVVSQLGRAGRGGGGGPLGVARVDQGPFAAGGALQGPQFAEVAGQGAPLLSTRARPFFPTTPATAPGVGATDLGLSPGIDFGPALAEQAMGVPEAGPHKQGFFGRNVFAPIRAEISDTAILMRQFGEVATDAFGTFQTSAVQALTAVALGTDSFGAALKKAAGAALVGTGQKLLGLAIEEGALGFAALANPFTAATAPLHFKAAAIATAGAAVTFGLARALGAGGQGAAAAPAVAGLGGGAASAGAIGGGTRSGGTTVVVGAEFADLSPSQRASRTRRVLELARINPDPNATVLYG